MNLEHMVVAVCQRRIPVGDACDEVLADAVLNAEAMRRRIIRPGTSNEQRMALLTYFSQARGGDL